MNVTWCPIVEAFHVRDTGDWRIYIRPMMFNHRIILSDWQHWESESVAGWCYEDGTSALLAALAFDPETQLDPVGFKKLAYDGRRTSKDQRDINVKVAGY